MRLDVRWTYNCRGQGQFEVYYCPVFEELSRNENRALQRPVSHELTDDLQADLNLLRDQLVVQTPDRDPLGGVPWTKTIVYFDRIVTPQYIDLEPEGYIRPTIVDSNRLGDQGRPRTWIDRDGLWPENLAIIDRIDEFARYKAHDSWILRYDEFRAFSDNLPSLPSPMRVFISYRAARQEVRNLAGMLHDNLSEGLSFFQVFLDREDLRAGEWRPQILNDINNSNAFIPMLSADYHEGNSEWEMQKALNNFLTSGRPVIVPLLIEGTWDDHPDQSPFQGSSLELRLIGNDFSQSVEKLRGYLGDGRIHGII